MRFMLQLTALVFFLLGAYTFTLIPTDTTPNPTPNVVLTAKDIFYGEGGYKCIMHNFDPAITFTCQK